MSTTITCSHCQRPFFRSVEGVFHHWGGERETINYGLDKDHVPYVLLKTVS